MKKLFSALLILPFMAGMAMADFTDSGAGGDIPDNGGPGNPFVSTIAGSGGGMVTDVTLTIEGLDHTWAGDLIIDLEHNGTSVNLSTRPGFPDLGAGFNIDLLGDFVFADGNPNYDALVEQQQANTDFGGDGFLTGDEGPFSGNDALSGFNGLDANGDWTLSISDNAGADTGLITGWTLTVSTSAIPEPTSLGVLVSLAGLGLVRRRR